MKWNRVAGDHLYQIHFNGTAAARQNTKLRHSISIYVFFGCIAIVRLSCVLPREYAETVEYFNSMPFIFNDFLICFRARHGMCVCDCRTGEYATF